MPWLNELDHLDHDPVLEVGLGMTLSQSSLQALSYCPRKFQYLYLEQLGLPNLPNPTATPETELPQDLGTWFHRLQQQVELGLDIRPLLATNEPLPTWYQAFQDNPPPMIDGLRDSEHRRQLALGNLTLVGVYDLLILGSGAAQILDWKTYARPQNPRILEKHWQTRLYPYLLAATTDYPPEEITITYWFALAPEQNHSLSFPYSSAGFMETQELLTQWQENLAAWFARYQEGQDLPQVEVQAGKCQHCEFASRCQRRGEADDRDSLNPSGLLAAMLSYPEIPIDTKIK